MFALLGACASTTPPPSVPADSLSIAPLPPDRLADVRAISPELADRVERIQALARAYARRGDDATAHELATMASTTLLAAALLAAEADAAAARQCLETQVEVAAAPVPIPEPEAREDEPRRRRRPRRRPEPEPEPQPVAAPERSTSDRLARVAARLADLSATTPETRVAIDGIETSLIEGDRALAEGLAERAAELATQAERQLAALTGDAAPAAEAQDGGLVAEARRRFGERALVRGAAVAVRLDPGVRFDDVWTDEDDRTVQQLRGLVRGYRDASLTLAHVGADLADARRESLVAFLAGRFQIPAARLRWRPPNVRLPAGLYLVLRETGDE